MSDFIHERNFYPWSTSDTGDVGFAFQRYKDSIPTEHRPTHIEDQEIGLSFAAGAAWMYEEMGIILTTHAKGHSKHYENLRNSLLRHAANYGLNLPGHSK